MDNELLVLLRSEGSHYKFWLTDRLAESGISAMSLGRVGKLEQGDGPSPAIVRWRRSRLEKIKFNQRNTKNRYPTVWLLLSPVKKCVDHIDC